MSVLGKKGQKVRWGRMTKEERSAYGKMMAEAKKKKKVDN